VGTDVGDVRLPTTIMYSVQARKGRLVSKELAVAVLLLPPGDEVLEMEDRKADAVEAVVDGDLILQADPMQCKAILPWSNRLHRLNNIISRPSHRRTLISRRLQW
jgi:hypothetical protein